MKNKQEKKPRKHFWICSGQLLIKLRKNAKLRKKTEKNKKEICDNDNENENKNKIISFYFLFNYLEEEDKSYNIANNNVVYW